MATPEEASHLEKAGNHGDVLKHIVLIQAIKAAQKAHPEGIIFVDTHCGPGSYNLGEQVRNANIKQGSTFHSGSVAQLMFLLFVLQSCLH